MDILTLIYLMSFTQFLKHNLGLLTYFLKMKLCYFKEYLAGTRAEKLIQASDINVTRNSSRHQIANVNFLYDNIVHSLQNTIHSCINCVTNRRGYMLKRMFTNFSQITQCNGHCAVQGHSRSPILVPIESSYTISY